MKLTKSQFDHYLEKDYVIVEDLFTDREIALLRRAANFICSAERPHQDANAWENIPGLSPAEVKKHGFVMLAAAVELDSPMFDLVHRLPRILEPVQQMLGEEVYLYQSRIAAKRGIRPGAVAGGDPYLWHQDYTQWRLDGTMRGSRHDMVSAAIMLDESTRENGCVRFVEGSHNLGLVDYEFRSGGTAYPARYATDEAMEDLLKRSTITDITGKPGTVVFFSGLVMHASDRNMSPKDRRMLYFVYNRMDNQPVANPPFEKRVTNNPYVLNPKPTRLNPIADDTWNGFLALASSSGSKVTGFS